LNSVHALIRHALGLSDRAAQSLYLCLAYGLALALVAIFALTLDAYRRPGR
jgi:hypothetical protein